MASVSSGNKEVRLQSYWNYRDWLPKKMLWTKTLERMSQAETKPPDGKCETKQKEVFELQERKRVGRDRPKILKIETKRRYE